MHQKTLVRNLFIWSVGLAVLVGCSQPETGPSYAELVVTYNAELEALDRLEAKRAKLVAEYTAAMKPPAGDTLSHLQGLLDSARELQEGGVNLDTTDPNALLDELAEQGGAAEDIANQLVDGLLGGQSADAEAAPESTAESTEKPTVESDASSKTDLEALKAKYESELAALDKEIAEQKTRVERARAARDEAEAKQR